MNLLSSIHTQFDLSLPNGKMLSAGRRRPWDWTLLDRLSSPAFWWYRETNAQWGSMHRPQSEKPHAVGVRREKEAPIRDIGFYFSWLWVFLEPCEWQFRKNLQILNLEFFRMSEIENFNFDEIFDENTVKVKKDFVDVKFILGKKTRSLFYRSVGEVIWI